MMRTDDPKQIGAHLSRLWREARQRELDEIREEFYRCVEEINDAIEGRLPTRAAVERAKRDPLRTLQPGP